MFRKMCFLMVMGMFLSASLAFGASPVTDGLVKHVDAGAITDLIDGDSVDVWADLAGFDDMVPYSKSPTYNDVDSINGLPVVSFRGGSNGLTAETSETHFAGDQPHTVFAVALTKGFSGNSMWQIGVNGGGTYSAFNLEGATSIGCRMGNGYNNFTPISPTPPYALDEPGLFVISYPGTTYADYALDIDGTAWQNATNASGNSLNMGASTIRIGNRDNNGTSFNGDIAEILLFNRALTADETNLVGFHLANKYGLTATYTDPGAYTVGSSPLGTDVDPDVTFEWEGLNGTGLTYVLNYSAAGEPNTVVTTTNTSHSVSLKMDTEYKWSVDIQGGFTGAVYPFTTAGKVALADPADGTIAVEQDIAELTWDEANVTGASYKVNFGTTDPPSYVTTVTEGSYPISAALDPNTVYYCSIDTVKGAETLIGDVASFTTGGFAHSPSPQDGSGGASTQPVLAWSGDRANSYMDSYDVYVGDSAGTLVFVANVTEPAYAITTELPEKTTRYWKVVGKHDGVAIGAYEPVWSFTTGRLLAYWPMGTPGDTVSGLTTTIVKETGEAGDPGVVSGVVGDATEFYGDSCYAMADPAGYFDGTANALTVAAWVKWDMSADSAASGTDDFRALEWAPFVTKSNGTEGDNGWSFQLYKYYFRPQLRTGADTATASGMYEFESTWHHIVASSSLAGRKMWIDGILVREYEGVGPWGLVDAPVSLGGRITDADAFERGLIGILDEVYVYDRAVTEEQALDLYKNSSMAKLPAPADGESEVAFDTDLTWVPGAAGFGIAKQTLTYGTTSDFSGATVVTDLAADADSYAIGANLELGTTYYWKVDSIASDDSVIWEGKVWAFTVMELAGDIVVNKIVDIDDLQAVADEWMDDSRSVPAGDIVVDWTAGINGANMDQYMFTYAGYYSKSWWELNESPVQDPNVSVPTLARTAQMHIDHAGSTWGSGAEIQTGFEFPEPISLDGIDKVTIWMKVVNVETNGYYMDPSWFTFNCWDVNGDGLLWDFFKPIDPLTNEPIGFTEASDANDGEGRWVKFEWNVASKTTAWQGIVFWTNWSGTNAGLQEARGLPAYWEIGDIVLTPAASEEPTCWLGADFSDADLNKDCDVNLLDFAELGLEWLMDAN